MTDPREHKDKWMLRSKVQPRLRAKDTIIEAAKAQLEPLKEEVRKLTELLEASGKDNDRLNADIKAVERVHLKTCEGLNERNERLLIAGQRWEDNWNRAVVSITELKAELEARDQTFDLIQAAQERAIECWQQSTKHSMVLPDWFDLTRWLLDRHDRGEQAFTDLNAQWSEQHDKGIHLRREEAIRRDEAIARAVEAERKLVVLRKAVLASQHLLSEVVNLECCVCTSDKECSLCAVAKELQSVIGTEGTE